MPKRFRQVELHHEEGHSVHGISGSGQFSKNTFLLLKKTLGHENAVIIDAREETHLHDQEGRAVSLRADHNFLNKGKKLHEIVEIEEEYVKQTDEGRTFDMYNLADQPAVVRFGTEEQLIKDIAPQYTYHRLPITDGHLASDEIIDQVIDIKQAAKREHKWIHVHCCLGRGRTSTILTLLYTIEHASKKSVSEIFDTLENLGNIKLRKMNSRKSEEENRRSDPFFWELFHKYCCQEEWKNSKWSEWRKSQPTQLQETVANPVKKQKTKHAKAIERTLDVEALKEHELTIKDGTLTTTR
ncbi:MAG: hypothetical protein JSR46_07270, partial [Verrucomicrobia bacterium]|nr:hypothetical protein [Verrucomicrobiota bacterium]